MSNVHGPAFAGLLTVLNPTNTSNLAHDIVDDMEGEQETLPNLIADDFEDDDKAVKAVVSQWRDSVTGASKRVTDKTHSEYQKWALVFFFYNVGCSLVTVLQSGYTMFQLPHHPWPHSTFGRLFLSKATSRCAIVYHSLDYEPVSMNWAASPLPNSISFIDVTKSFSTAQTNLHQRDVTLIHMLRRCVRQWHIHLVVFMG